MSDRPVRIAIAGLGGHGRTIQDASAASPDLEIVALYDPKEEEAIRSAELFGAAVAASFPELIARDDIDALVLVTPNHLHLQQTLEALDQGLHVFVEKPIANTVADGLRMVEAAEKAGRLLMVGHNMRMGPALEHAREAVTNRIGRIVSVEVHFSADNTHRMPPDAWRLRPDLCPLLPVMQLGIHGIDLVHDLAGPVTSVNAVARAVTTSPGVLDSVSAVFTLESGATGTIVSNYCTQIRFEYRISGTGGTIVGTPHTVWFRSNSDTDGKGDGVGETHDYSAMDRASYERQMQAFAEAVRAGTTEVLSARDGLQALAVVEAMHRSALSGTTEAIPAFNRHPVG
jgi:predicted dehydrogenase